MRFFVRAENGISKRSLRPVRDLPAFSVCLLRVTPAKGGHHQLLCRPQVRSELVHNTQSPHAQQNVLLHVLLEFDEFTYQRMLIVSTFVIESAVKSAAAMPWLSIHSVNS